MSPSVSYDTSLDDESISQSSDSMHELLLNLTQINEDILLHNHGYRIMHKICDTMQGDLFKALNVNTNRFVAIKKTDKQLFAKRIAIQDRIHFCVTENIIKEAHILKYLTVDNTPIGDYIVQYIDFFESGESYYLVMEYIASETDLKQFILKAKRYIQCGKMDIKAYQKTMKFLLWQLFVTVQWLHLSMKCCHLDLCLENVLLKNANFIETNHGIVIDQRIAIKLSDFGVSEVFKKDYLCLKQPLSLENTAYASPTVFDEEEYDAECADNWSLGMLLFEIMTAGKHIYNPLEIHALYSGYWALKHDQLRQYLAGNNMLSYFNVCSFSILTGLLSFNERNRLKGMDILKHEWFDKYYKRYQRQIAKKFSRCGKGLSQMNFYEY
eukprot:35389_1